MHLSEPIQTRKLQLNSKKKEKKKNWGFEGRYWKHVKRVPQTYVTWPPGHVVGVFSETNGFLEMPLGAQRVAWHLIRHTGYIFTVEQDMDKCLRHYNLGWSSAVDGDIPICNVAVHYRRDE